MTRLRWIAALLLVFTACDDRVAGGSSTTGNSLSARIRSPDGTPAEGDTAFLRPDLTDSVAAPAARSVAGPGGVVRFPAVPDGDWVLEVRGAVRGRLVRLRMAGAARDIEVATAEFGAIQGAVRLPQDRSGGIAFLDGTGQVAPLDSLGRFLFPRASPGPQRVVALPRPDGSSGVARSAILDLAPAVRDSVPPLVPSLPRVVPGWSLVWKDDFASFDSTRWSVDTGNGCPDLCGWGKGALQSFRRGSVSVRGGAMVLSADSTPSGWTSGQVQTRDNFRFRYGRLEVDAVLPAAVGAWSLISLQGDSTGRSWPAAGAVDIAALRGSQPDSLMGIAHFADPHEVAQHPGTTFSRSGGWGGRRATYAVEWSPGSVVWLVDDQVFFRVDGGPPFDRTFYLSIGLTVGGDGNVAPAEGASFQLSIEQVRLYQRQP